ncbi:tlg2-vesicle protein of 38 kda [Diaporthe amygdali]|uniref:tlg2-vesicle protein of 38 kda n=1 Tax=Phomopsis amygdali TaxID=1214568 RepID=UPI0022FE28D4|nr:tlg2-vesicle protein of 38 kda [Diaporthe amygdali]KAJ0121327.1 tlg2-vesicle protein of 38 kda [Diaporthe amygdali]
MPADYKSAAAGLAVPMSPDNKTPSAASAAAQLANTSTQVEHGGAPFHDDSDPEEQARPSPTPSYGDNEPPLPWVRHSSNANGNTRSSRRLSTPYSLNSRSSANRDGFRSQLSALASSSIKTANGLYRQSVTMYEGLTPTQKVLFIVGGNLLGALTIVLLIFSHKIFTLLGPVAVSWRALPAGWLIIWAATFFVAFPPLVGYSTACTVAGFVYGFPLGWPIVATATVAGSAAAFVASRTVLSGYVDRLVGRDKRFVALGQVLRHDGLGVLALVRFCPLPYSLSNGFLATVPSIQPLSFAIATAFSSPKLLVHVFIGSRLALLAEKEMTFGDRLVNYASMLVGGLVGMGVGYFIYRRTMARAAELAREEAQAGRPLDGRAPGAEYADDDIGEGGEDARLMDPNDAAALMVDDDDISLWDTTGDSQFEDEDAPARYRDEEEAVGGHGTARKPGDATQT